MEMTMQLPESLPARVYLAAYDAERNRLTGRSWLGYALRGAALADLLLSGHIVDDNGRVQPGTLRTASTDPVLQDVLSEVVAAPGVRWRSLVNRHRRETKNAVAAQLDAGGWIQLDRPATWWRRSRISLRDVRSVSRVKEQVAAVLRSPMPIDRTPPTEVALVAVLALAEIRTAISRDQKRQYGDRIKAAVVAAGPPIDALKHAISQARQRMSS
jgi:Golgi phosphoprotein 3 (GPP34)